MLMRCWGCGRSAGLRARISTFNRGDHNDASLPGRQASWRTDWPEVAGRGDHAGALDLPAVEQGAFRTKRGQRGARGVQIVLSSFALNFS